MADFVLVVDDDGNQYRVPAHLQKSFDAYVNALRGPEKNSAGWLDVYRYFDESFGEYLI